MGYKTHEDDSWSCYVCGEVRSRVVFIPESPNEYYCSKCLFDAIRDGDLTLAETEHSNACDNCESDGGRVYCYECARDQWDLHDSGDCDHEWCHDECGPTECEKCYNGVEAYLCEEHMRDYVLESLRCCECGDYIEPDPSQLKCERCERQSDVARAAQTVVTTTGQEMTFDDGTVIRWHEEG